MHTPTIDPDSPLLVTKATGALALLGATTGGTLAVLRAQQPLPLVLTMGLNGAVAGLSFFGIREYFVSPLLVASLDWPSYLRRRTTDDDALSQDGITPDEKVSFIRIDRVLDSALAGGIAGSSISGLVRGRRTVPASFITSALITATLQYSLNTLRVARIQTLVSRQRNNPSQEPTNNEPLTRGESFLARVQGTLGKWSPVRKLSDEEYAGILQRQRGEVRAALDAWERWMAVSATSGGKVPVEGKRPEINVEQATRELDSLERKIRGLEEKIREGREGVIV